jgi:hypothetical protein
MALMFPSLFRSPIRGKYSLLLMGVGLGEDSCPKVFDRSRLSPGSGGVEPLTGSRTEKESLSARRQNYIAWSPSWPSFTQRPKGRAGALGLAQRQLVAVIDAPMSCRDQGLASCSCVAGAVTLAAGCRDSSPFALLPTAYGNIWQNTPFFSVSDWSTQAFRDQQANALQNRGQDSGIPTVSEAETSVIRRPTPC